MCFFSGICILWLFAQKNASTQIPRTTYPWDCWFEILALAEDIYIYVEKNQ